MITTERFKLHSPYSHQICIIVRARSLCIIGDLDLHLQGHDLDPGPRSFTCIACIFWVRPWNPDHISIHSCPSSFIRPDFVKCNQGRQISSVSEILSCKWYHCVQDTKHHHMNLISLCLRGYCQSWFI